MSEFNTTLARYRKIQATILLVLLVLSIIVYVYCVYQSIGSDKNEFGVLYRSMTKGQTIVAFLCGLASAISTFVGCATYLYLPKLRKNIHGKTRLCFMFSKLVTSLTYPVMVVVDNFHFVSSNNPLMEAIARQLPSITSIVYCFWLTVMGFLTWTTFSKPLQASGASQEEHKFLYCCLFAWGIPFALFILHQVCFFCFDFPLLYTLKFSWKFNILINIVMIVSTIINLNLHRSATNSVLGKTVATEDIFTYIKLFSITGIDSCMLFFAALSRIELFIFFSFCFLFFQGVCQFVLFVLNKRVLALFREKRSGSDENTGEGCSEMSEQT